MWVSTQMVRIGLFAGIEDMATSLEALKGPDADGRTMS
jgi:hypothetical protein